jgi:hypothetical protein
LRTDNVEIIDLRSLRPGNLLSRASQGQSAQVEIDAADDRDIFSFANYRTDWEKPWLPRFVR